MIDESGPDLEDEHELDPSTFMEDISGADVEGIEGDGEESIIEDIEDGDESIEITGMPQIGDVMSIAE